MAKTPVAGAATTPTLAALTAQARSTFGPVKFRVTRGNNSLEFTVSDWLPAYVIRLLMERDGWHVEEHK